MGKTAPERYRCTLLALESSRKAPRFFHCLFWFMCSSERQFLQPVGPKRIFLYRSVKPKKWGKRRQESWSSPGKLAWNFLRRDDRYQEEKWLLPTAGGCGKVCVCVFVLWSDIINERERDRKRHTQRYTQREWVSWEQVWSARSFMVCAK